MKFMKIFFVCISILLFFSITILIGGCTMEDFMQNNDNQDIVVKGQEGALEAITETDNGAIKGVENKIVVPKTTPQEDIVQNKNNCGDGYCQEITCMGPGCPPIETPESCPEDCGRDIGSTKNIKNCSVNSDCIIAGCSNEICSKVGEQTISTCEGAPWFKCLPKTQCLCIDGQCQWEQNDEYLNCMGEYDI